MQEPLKGLSAVVEAVDDVVKAAMNYFDAVEAQALRDTVASDARCLMNLQRKPRKVRSSQYLKGRDTVVQIGNPGGQSMSNVTKFYSSVKIFMILRLPIRIGQRTSKGPY